MPEYPPDRGGPVGGGGTPQPTGTPTPNPLESWKKKRYINDDGTVTLPWGEIVSLAAAMNMYYKNGRQPTGEEVPPWVLGGWAQATGTANRQYQFAPSWFGNNMQQLYNLAFTNAVRSGQPPVNVAGGRLGADYWKQMGWVDQDGKVTLPTGARVSLADAMNLYYKDRKPNANEIPAWAEASQTLHPIQYINQIPAHLRGVFEQMLNQAYPAGSAGRPAVSYMQGQSSFR